VMLNCNRISMLLLQRKQQLKQRENSKKLETILVDGSFKVQSFITAGRFSKQL
jgi:hypothetical protein